MSNLIWGASRRILDDDGDPAGGGKITVYTAGTTSAVTTYSDVNLATANASPVVADAAGIVGPIFIADSVYKIRVTDASDVVLYEDDYVTVGSGNGYKATFGTVALMVADAQTYDFFAAGDYVHVTEGGFTYKVAATGASDNDLITAGSVKLYVLPDAQGSVSVDAFGAIGDYDGTTVTTNSTTAIEAAFDWLAADGQRHIHFGDGWYYYNGNKTVDLGSNDFQKVSCDGAVCFASSGIAWTIHNGERFSFQLNVKGGGTAGDFSARTAGGSGTTAVQIYEMRAATVRIDAINYAGRVSHFTASGASQELRCTQMDINLKSGNRVVGGDDALCGQITFCDAVLCDQKGGFGKVTIRTEGQVYGPVFEHLNDLDFPSVEMGKFSTAGPKILGCVGVFSDMFYVGETNAAAGADDYGLEVNSSTASGTRQCSDVNFGQLRILLANGGAFFKDFADTDQGLWIGQFVGYNDDAALLEFDDMPAVRVDSIHIDNGGEAASTDAVLLSNGGGYISLNFVKVDGVKGDVVQVSNHSYTQIEISGRIDGGSSALSSTAGKSLVNLGTTNNFVNLFNLNLKSSAATQLINIGFTGASNIRHVGGSVSGAQTYTTSRIPELIRDVDGHQTESCGLATMANGTSSKSVTHGLAATPQHVTVTPLAVELTDVYVTAIGATTFTVNVGANTTADRDFDWTASATRQRGDVNA